MKVYLQELFLRRRRERAMNELARLTQEDGLYETDEGVEG